MKPKTGVTPQPGPLQMEKFLIPPQCSNCKFSMIEVNFENLVLSSTDTADVILKFTPDCCILESS